MRRGAGSTPRQEKKEYDMKEYVKMFEAGGFAGGRFERIGTLMHSFLLDWRDYGYELQPNLDLITLDLPDLLSHL